MTLYILAQGGAIIFAWGPLWEGRV